VQAFESPAVVVSDFDWAEILLGRDTYTGSGDRHEVDRLKTCIDTVIGNRPKIGNRPVAEIS
jgi:hypothetical protein